MDHDVSTRRKSTFGGIDKDHDSSSSCRMCDECCLLKDLQNEGQKRPSDCFNPMYPPPPWYDKTKFRRGQLWFQSKFICVIVSNLVGLLCLLSCENILKVLQFTDKSSNTGKAFKRYLHTINHIRLWYTQDIFDASTRASKSIELVRRMHAVSHTDAKNAQVAMPSQLDMVVTQWAFFGLVLTHGQQLGIKGTRDDEEALIHFWKTIGYLMGIEDRYNLAFGSIKEVKRNCHALVHQIIVPSMKTPPDGFAPMSDALLDGVHQMVPPADPSAFMNFTKTLLGLKEDQQSLAIYSQFMFNVMMLNFNTWLHIPALGDFLLHLENGLLGFALFVCNLLPVVPRRASVTEKILRIWKQLLKYIAGVLRDISVMLRLQNS